jgi:hypothetical protein
VGAAIVALLLQALAGLGRVGAHTAGALASMLVSVYEVYISIPLRIERALRGAEPASRRPAAATPAAKRGDEPRASWS